MKKLSLALCEGRHEIPEAVDGSIFRNAISDVTDTEKMEKDAYMGIWNAAYMHYKTGESGFLAIDPDWDGCDEEPLVLATGLAVDLYVTGLTVALIAVLNVCRSNAINVTLWHFDRESGRYYTQKVK